MTTDHDIRALLAQAIPDQPLQVDESTVLTQGSRVVRRRRIGATVTSVIACALAVWGLTWAASPRDVATSIPAGPHPTSTSADGNTDGEPLPPYTAEPGHVIARFPMVGTDQGGMPWLVVDLDPRTGEYWWSSPNADGTVDGKAGGSVAGMPKGMSTWGHGAKIDQVVGLVPGTATSAFVLTGAPLLPDAVVQPLPGSGWSAFRFVPRDASERREIQGVVWIDSAGNAHGSRMTAGWAPDRFLRLKLTSPRGVTPSFSETVYVSPSAGVAGTSHGLGEWTSGQPYVVSLQLDKAEYWLMFGVVRKGAAAPKLTVPAHSTWVSKPTIVHGDDPAYDGYTAAVVVPPGRPATAVTQH